MLWRRRNIVRGWSDRVVRQESLDELIRAVASASDGPALRATALSHFLALADCRAGWFVEQDRRTGTFATTWSVEEGTSGGTPLVFQPQGPLASWLRLNGTPLIFPGRTGVDAYLHEDERRQLEANGVGACIPIVAVGRLLAVIALGSRHSWDLAPDLGEFLMVCAHHVGLAYQTLARHQAAVEEIRSAAHTQRLAVAGQLAAMVAHEVRNPLSIVRSAVQLVRETDEGFANRHDLLRDAIAEIDRISTTVEGLLSLTRPALGRKERLDVVAVVADAIRLVGTYAIDREIEIGSRHEFDSLYVLGDPRELRQVFLNILLNASQAMDGTGTITIRTSLVEEVRDTVTGHGSMAVVSVIDTGRGIPPTLIDSIFEPFVSTKPSGTGLGLAICSQIVANHGGRIAVESEVGIGTTVRVFLPLKIGA